MILFTHGLAHVSTDPLPASIFIRTGNKSVELRLEATDLPALESFIRDLHQLRHVVVKQARFLDKKTREQLIEETAESDIDQAKDIGHDFLYNVVVDGYRGLDEYSDAELVAEWWDRNFDAVISDAGDWERLDAEERDRIREISTYKKDLDQETIDLIRIP